MDNNLVIYGCNVILKDKSAIASNSSKGYENKGKILIIDITNNKEDKKSISENDFGDLVEKYIKEHEFNGTKTIVFNELLPIKIRNIFIEFLFYILNKIFDDNGVVKRLENSKWINKIMATVGVFVLFFFYNLGYAFLYGYYFGGDLGNKTSFLKIYVNPVPFNFKSIAFIGLGLLIYILLIFLPLIKILMSKNKSKNIFNIIVFFYSILVLVISSSYVFIGAFNKDVIVQNMIYFIITIIIFPLTLFMLVLFLILAIDYTLVFFSSFIYSIFLLLFISYKFQIPHDYKQLFMYYSAYFIPILLTHFLRGMLFLAKWIRNEIIRINVQYVIIFGSVAIIFSIKIKNLTKINFLSIHYLLLIIFSFGILLLVIFIIKLVFNKIVKKVYFKIKTIIDKTHGIIVLRTNDKTSKKRVDVYLIATAIGLSIIITFATVSLGIVETGKMTRYFLMGLSKDKIIYEKADDKKENQYVFGDIVALKDNTYFISKLPERKLMTIKNTNVISLPCEEFWINRNLDKFNELENNLCDKYNHLSSNNNIKITCNSDPLIMRNDQIDFYKNVYRRSNAKTNDNNYDFGISVKVNYLIKDENIDKFSLVFGYKFPNKISNEEDKRLKQEMELMFSDYRNAVIQYFNIPVLDARISKYYYSNGLIEFTPNINGDKNGRYEETYSFSAVAD